MIDNHTSIKSYTKFWISKLTNIFIQMTLTNHDGSKKHFNDFIFHHTSQIFHYLYKFEYFKYCWSISYRIHEERRFVGQKGNFGGLQVYGKIFIKECEFILVAADQADNIIIHEILQEGQQVIRIELMRIPRRSKFHLDDNHIWNYNVTRLRIIKYMRSYYAPKHIESDNRLSSSHVLLSMTYRIILITFQLAVANSRDTPGPIITQQSRFFTTMWQCDYGHSWPGTNNLIKLCPKYLIIWFLLLI